MLGSSASRAGAHDRRSAKKTLHAVGASDGSVGREQRERVLSAVAELVPAMATRRALRALGAAHATWYRRRAPRKPAVARPRPAPPLALSGIEREAILATLNSPRFADTTPYTAWARLLDEGTYLASVRTFYRLLGASGLLQERRAQLVHPAHVKPELVATAPNQVWSWGHDAAAQRRRIGSSSTSMWRVLDIFSRYVVGWLVAGAENAGLASALIEETCAKYGIARDTLTLHSDRGSPMRAKTTAELLVDLGVAASYSRPRGVQRQPVLGVPVQDAQVSARVPGVLRQTRPSPLAFARVLHLVQRRAPPFRDRLHDPNNGALRPSTGDRHPTSAGPARGLRCPPQGVSRAGHRCRPQCPRSLVSICHRPNPNLNLRRPAMT